MASGIGGDDWCSQLTICSTAPGSSSVRSITPVSDSRNGFLHAPSKNSDLEQTRARCTEYLFVPQRSVRSEYLPHSNSLGQLSKEVEKKILDIRCEGRHQFNVWGVHCEIGLGGRKFGQVVMQEDEGGDAFE